MLSHIRTQYHPNRRTHRFSAFLVYYVLVCGFSICPTIYIGETTVTVVCPFRGVSHKVAQR